MEIYPKGINDRFTCTNAHDNIKEQKSKPPKEKFETFLCSNMSEDYARKEIFMKTRNVGTYHIAIKSSGFHPRGPDLMPVIGTLIRCP